MSAAEDVVYRRAGGSELLARLYRGKAGCPAVVEVHGGAWTMNDRTANAAIHERLAADGVTVLALDFRMAPAHRYPAAVHDVNYGMRWLKANAAHLGLAPSAYGLLGTSSGGQLAVLCALQPDRFAEAEPTLAGHDARAAFVVACWPILDPLARYRMARGKGLDELVRAHHAFWPDEAAMEQGSPQHVLQRRDAASLPPMLVLQGTGDQNVEHERADLFASAYRSAGGRIELVKFEGQPHTFIAKAPSAPASLEALERIARFLQAISGEASSSRIAS